jgi:hypothetical protein
MYTLCCLCRPCCCVWVFVSAAVAAIGSDMGGVGWSRLIRAGDGQGRAQMFWTVFGCRGVTSV